MSYIGESKRQLLTRIKEHNTPSRKTAVSEHILGNNQKRIEPCLEYNMELTNTCGRKPTPQNKITFLQNCFNVIQTGMTNYHDRTIFEAIAITIEQPKLNAQVKHRHISII